MTSLPRLNRGSAGRRLGAVGLLALALLLPTAVGYAVLGLARALRWWGERRRPVPVEPPLHSVAADLRRLHDAVDRVELARDLPAKRLRLTAARAAYVDALVSACRRLDVEPPAVVGSTVPQVEIYRVEAALRRRGLDVRGPSAA